MATYTYTKYPINAEQLKDELFTEFGYAAADVAYADISRADNLFIVFNDELSSQDEQRLNNVVNSHTKIVDYKKFKINNSEDSPELIDYDIIGLHKKRTITFGELVTVQYYNNYDGTTYSDLVVEETRVYNRDANGLAQTRDLTIKWYYKNDVVGLIKPTTKYYSPAESIEEGINRRSNIIAQAKIYTLGAVGQANAFDLLSTVKNEIQLFLDGYTDPLRNAINVSTKPYLTQAIKDGIIENLRLS